MIANVEVVPGVIIQPGRNDIEVCDLGASGFVHYKFSRNPIFMGFDPGQSPQTFVVPVKFSHDPIVLACRVPIGDPRPVVCDGLGNILASKVNAGDYEGYGYEGEVLVVLSGQGGNYSFRRYSISCAPGMVTISINDLLIGEDDKLFRPALLRLRGKAEKS